ncbi:MAG: alpha/beta hydrolase [Chloroflexi bacterium]|nr:alpha/beta hydrolase [Chloroflexota bacterium]
MSTTSGIAETPGMGGEGESAASSGESPAASTRPPRVLLLHGILAGKGVWGPVRRELGGEAVTLAPDLLGHATANRPCEEYTLERVIEHLGPVVERFEPTHVVGHSMGAIVALGLAASNPLRFERVGLIGLPIYKDRADGLAYLRGRGLLRRTLLQADGASHTGCIALNLTWRVWGPGAALIVPHQPRAKLRAMFDHSRDCHTGSLERIIFGGLVEELAGRVTAPVAALHGGRDRSAPIERVRALAAANGWDLKVAPTGRHQICIERPGMTARWIREWVLAPGC